MAKFIELHPGEDRELLNIDHIVSVKENEAGGAYITLDTGGWVLLQEETYDQIRQMIATTQGGIPMDHSRMY